MDPSLSFVEGYGTQDDEYIGERFVMYNVPMISRLFHYVFALAFFGVAAGAVYLISLEPQTSK